MTCPEITPHLNKLVKINLSNRRRKVGWLLYNREKQVPSDPFEEVLCMDVPAGRKMMNGGAVPGELERRTERLHINEIQSIRSCL